MEYLDANSLCTHFGANSLTIYPSLPKLPNYKIGEVQGNSAAVDGFIHKHELYENEFYREIISLELRNVGVNSLGHYTVRVPNRQRYLQIVDSLQFPDEILNRAVSLSSGTKPDNNVNKDRVEVDYGFCLLRPGDKIYGHWLIDILPKVWMLHTLQKLSKIKFILHPDTPQFAINMLFILGVNQDQLVYFDPLKETIEIKKAIYISNLRTNQLIHPTISNFSKWFEDKILNENSRSMVSLFKRVSQDRTKSGARIFISRSEWKNHSNKRVCINAKEIEKIAETEYGFKIIHPQDMSLQEQVKEFKGAYLIVGEEGSGLHNNIFAPKNAHIVTLRGPRNHGIIQSSLCRAKKQTIHAIFGTADIGFEMDRNANFEISVDDFKLLMRSFKN